MENRYRHRAENTFRGKFSFIVGGLIQPSIPTYLELGFFPKKPYSRDSNFRTFFNNSLPLFSMSMSAPFHSCHCSQTAERNSKLWRFRAWLLHLKLFSNLSPFRKAFMFCRLYSQATKLFTSNWEAFTFPQTAASWMKEGKWEPGSIKTTLLISFQKTVKKQVKQQQSTRFWGSVALWISIKPHSSILADSFKYFLIEICIITDI